jgi:hypothetical protein
METIAQLQAEIDAFFAAHPALEPMSVDDYVRAHHDALTEDERQYLHQFVERWFEAEDAEDAA